MSRDPAGARPDPTDGQPVVRLDGVSMVFGGAAGGRRVEALQGIDLDVGGTTHLVGAKVQASDGKVDFGSSITRQNLSGRDYQKDTKVNVDLTPGGLTKSAVDFFTGDQTVRPGVRVERTGGHTGQHQIVYLESGGKTAVFVADLIPTTAHLQDPWVMGYDLFPMETMAFKKRFIREAIEREYLVLFEHDPIVAAGIIRERDGKRFVDLLLKTFAG